jgi:hypothetical protein
MFLKCTGLYESTSGTDHSCMKCLVLGGSQAPRSKNGLVMSSFQVPCFFFSDTPVTSTKWHSSDKVWCSSDITPSSFVFFCCNHIIPLCWTPSSYCGCFKMIWGKINLSEAKKNCFSATQTYWLVSYTTLIHFMVKGCSCQGIMRWLIDLRSYSNNFIFACGTCPLVLVSL